MGFNSLMIVVFFFLPITDISDVLAVSLWYREIKMKVPDFHYRKRGMKFSFLHITFSRTRKSVGIKQKREKDCVILSDITLPTVGYHSNSCKMCRLLFCRVYKLELRHLRHMKSYFSQHNCNS